MAQKNSKKFGNKKGSKRIIRPITVLGLLTIVIVVLSLANPFMRAMFLILASLMVFFLPVIILFAFIFIPPILGINDRIRLTRASTKAPSTAKQTENL